MARLNVRGTTQGRTKFIILNLLFISGMVIADECFLPKVHECFTNVNTTVLSENQTAFCNNEIGKLTQCLKPYDAACKNESLYKLNIEAFQPSVFGCNDNGSLQCDVKAIQRCYSNLDTSTIVTNVTLFCIFNLKEAQNCLMVYKDVCLSSSYSDLYQSLNASLQPNQYGCLDTSGVQCELFTATRCILDFNFDRIEHLQSTGWPSTNTTALCGHLQKAEACITPYENACKSKPSFIKMKRYLKPDICKEPVTPTSSGSSTMANVILNAIVLLFYLIYQ